MESVNITQQQRTSLGVGSTDTLGTIFTTILERFENVSRIESGSYVGNGLQNASYPNTLTFSFVPKVVFILSEQGDEGGASYYAFTPTFIQGVKWAATVLDGTGSSRQVVVNWSNSTVTWYSSSPSLQGIYAQLNVGGRTYSYVAIG